MGSYGYLSNSESAILIGGVPCVMNKQANEQPLSALSDTSMRLAQPRDATEHSQSQSDQQFCENEIDFREIA